MLKIGIVGTGGIAGAHAEGYRRFAQECEVVAVCDIVPGKAAEQRARLQVPGARAYESIEELLAAEPDLDLVSITTPPSTHAELTVTAPVARRRCGVARRIIRMIRRFIIVMSGARDVKGRSVVRGRRRA